MSDKRMAQLLERVAKLEEEVRQLKSSRTCGTGWEGIFGSQKDNPFFDEVVAEIEKERAAERKRLGLEPIKKKFVKKQAARRTTKKQKK